MALSREKKGNVLERLKEIIKDSATVVFAGFNGLKVSETVVLRKDLKKAGVTYLVGKKSLLKKVLKESNIPGEAPSLPGEISLAFGKDLLEPARHILSFQKKLGDKLTILGGIFDGKFINKAEMVEIAQIPPKEILYGKFVNLINSPIQRLVIGLNKVAEKKTI